MNALWLAILPLALHLSAAEPAGSLRLENATNAFAEILRSPDKGIPKDLLDKAQCVIIVPDLLKAAFIVGGKYGRGFASCRHDAGWTAPAAVRIEGGSFGFQLGGSSTDLIMLVMNHRGMRRLLGTKFTLGGEAAAAAGPVGRSTSAQTDLAMQAEILTWSRSRGIFGGISLEGATLRPDVSENRKLYGRDISNREILSDGVRPPSAALPLIAMLDRESPAEALSRPGGRLVLGEQQIRFATAQSIIPTDAGPALVKLAQSLQNHPDWHVRIDGFTDNIGAHDANAKLSQDRAAAVRDWLVAHGIDQSRLTAKGYGASHPIASNATGSGRARNRRVEIVRVEPPQTTGF